MLGECDKALENCKYSSNFFSFLQEYNNRPLVDIIEALRHMNSIYCQCQLWGIILNREGPNYEINGETVLNALRNLYYRAGTLRYWRAVRYCSSLLHHTVDSISPFITTVLVNGKQLTVGVISQKETVFDKPMTPAEIQNVMYTTVQPFDVIQAVLQQEVVLYCGRLIATNPDIFKGVLKIRIGWVLEAMRLYLNMSGQASDLDNLSPFSVRILLQRILTVSEWALEEKLTVLQRRQLEGCLCRVPKTFYNSVWDVLSRTPKGISVQSHLIPSDPTLTSMSRSELAFSLLVEETFNHILLPERRQLSVELLCIVATILARNPELRFKDVLDLDKLLDDAYKMYCKDNQITITKDITPLYKLGYNETTGYLARATVNTMLQGGALAPQTDEDIPDFEEETCKVS